MQATLTTPQAKERLEEIRASIENENASYEEIAELSSLIDYIDSDDVLLLEWAGVPEDETDDQEKSTWEMKIVANGQLNYAGRLTDEQIKQVVEFANDLVKNEVI